MFPISIGAEIYFAEGADTLAGNLLEVKPTIMTAVPRLYEALHRRITLGVERKGGLTRRLFDKATVIGRKRMSSQALTLLEGLFDPLLDLLVRAKLRRRFGGRLKAMVSGGAPLNAEIGSFFLALGVRLLQGYGQTEAAPVIACNSPAHIKIDTVGPPLDGVRVKLADDGEILVAGDNVMKGYWNDPEATARVFEDGWLKTGDVGLLDDEGYIRITDRKRDFIKNSGGETISPAHVEGYLTLEPEIAQAMVFGDRRPYLVAVLVPDADFAAAHLARDETAPEGAAEDFRALAGHPDFARAIGAGVARVNQRLSPVERVRRFVIAAEPFSIANGQMTPTLKIKRHVIREVYGATLDALYEGREIAA
jgi:long-chain acyl-CoA synthetase